MDTSKRRWILGDWLKGTAGESRPKSTSETEHYFDSFEECYPLLASADSLLIDEARSMGVNIKGKSKEAIAREVFKRGFKYPNDV
jgi:hypothetical protein